MSSLRDGYMRQPGDAMRRIPHHVARPRAETPFTDAGRKRGAGIPILTPRSDAVVENRTVFKASRQRAEDATSVLKSGYNHAKIGKAVVHGPWEGMPIFVLTLEERATCPSCVNVLNCYGNTMPFAKRISHGPLLEAKLIEEVSDLAAKHRHGFAVRPHVLGDFYSAQYAALWAGLLAEHRQLHLWGYTAHPPASVIGKILMLMNTGFPRRCVFRFSNAEDAPPAFRAMTARNHAEAIARDLLPCPAQRVAEPGKADCCGTCGACWQSKRPIAFLEH